MIDLFLISIFSFAIANSHLSYFIYVRKIFMLVGSQTTAVACVFFPEPTPISILVLQIYTHKLVQH